MRLNDAIKIQDIGIKVAIMKFAHLAGNRRKRGVRPIFLEFLLHPLDHGDRFISGAEVGRACCQRKYQQTH